MRILREPLLHFLVAGAAIFLLFDSFGAPADEERGRIVVTQTQIARLATLWERARGQPPTDAELSGLVEDHIREEVYYREALALGLERDDTVIRRRLRQKMEFLAVDTTLVPEPLEADLIAYLERHGERFRIEGKAAFRQVYLNAAKRGAALARDAEALRNSLAVQGPDADISALGDPIQLPSEFTLSAATDIARVFGRGFVDDLMEQAVGTWAGPIQSGYGYHLVLVQERIAGRPASFAEVRDAVARDWRGAMQRQQEQERFERLREGYEISIEWPSPQRVRVEADD